MSLPRASFLQDTLLLAAFVAPVVTGIVALLVLLVGLRSAVPFRPVAVAFLLIALFYVAAIAGFSSEGGFDANDNDYTSLGFAVWCAWAALALVMAGSWLISARTK